jgi:hypothetical protein
MRGTRITRVSGDAVVSARHQRTIFWGVCAAVLALGLAVAWSSQPTMTGKVQSVVFFSLFIGLCAFLWWYQNRLRSRIQVTPDEIRYWHQGRYLQFTLSRRSGGQLCIVPGVGPGRLTWGPRITREPLLTIVGSGDYLGVGLFRLGAIRRACESRGWSFDGDGRLLAADARAWWQQGKLAEAAQLAEVFGPFAEDGDSTAAVSLSAAILEAYGDSLGRGAAARAAYQRAAAAQRSYAAFASSGSEGSARMSEAGRLDAKASA